VSIWDNPAIVGAIGVAFGGATAYIQGALSARAKAGEELRDRRLAAYPLVWRETATLSRYPGAEVTWADLKALHVVLRRWYFTTGGLFLSARSRDRYYEVQELLGAYLLVHMQDDSPGSVDSSDYDEIAETCSVFRAAMTEDLETRRQRSLIWTLWRWGWHWAKKREARQRIKAAGDGFLRCPLDELRLPVSESQPRPTVGSG
jgi:hypothetical protein